MKKKKDKTYYGEITINKGADSEDTIKIVDYMQTTFKDHRLISVVGLEDDKGIVISVENPASTGRATSAQIWLTLESCIGVLSSTMMYLNAKGIDVSKAFEASINKKAIDFKYGGMKDPGQAVVETLKNEK